MGSIANTKVILWPPIPNNGSFTAPYPAGTTQAFLQGSNMGELALPTGESFPQGAGVGQVEFAFGPSSITVTNRTGLALFGTVVLSFGRIDINGAYHLTTPLKAQMMDGGGPGPTPDVMATVSYLPDPSLSTSGDRYDLAGSPVIRALFNGAMWVDADTSQEIAPYWLPRGAALHVDFINNHFYWGGAVRALSDLTAVAGGGYYLNHGFGFTDTAVVSIDMSYNQAGPPSGTYFSWTSGYPSGDRVEWSPDANATHGRGMIIYINRREGAAADSYGFERGSKAGGGGAVYIGNGIHRYVTRLKSGAPIMEQPDNGTYRTATAFGNIGVLAVPTRLAFGARAWAPSEPNTPMLNATLRRVTIYNTDLPIEHVNAIGSTGNERPIHFLGDSFLNLYGVYEQFKNLNAANGYVGMSQDGIGGTSLAQQAIRFAADNPKWHDSTLVICEFGPDGTTAERIAALESIIGTLNHDRWIFMEPAPQTEGPPAAYLADCAALKAFCGDHYVETRLPAYAASNGSAEDEAEVAKGLWPLSLKISVTDFHPSRAAGQAFIAGLVRNALLARGWL